MLPLQRIERLQQQMLAMLEAMPVASLPLPSRQHLHGELAGYWAAADSQGRSRARQLADLRRAMMHAEADLRLADQTMSADLAAIIATVLDLPYAWQRRHLPPAQRAQAYRPVLLRSRPAWRAALPGMFVIATAGEEGQNLDPDHTTGPVLLLGLAQGMEAYATLGELHQELCERLDDPLQSMPLLRLLVNDRQIENALQADRLRYEWYADDPLQAQADCLLEAQRLRLNHAWPALPANEPERAAEKLRQAMALREEAGSKALLDTRYAALLESNLPGWLRSASPQALAHIMQGMQELIATGQQVAAPGILTLKQFRQHETLQDWAGSRVRDRLRHDLGLTVSASDILVNVVYTRQTGPWLNPLQPSPHVTWRGFERVGGALVEVIHASYPLDELAIRNLAWFDYDYWLTARVTSRDGSALPNNLNPNYIKALVRSLNVGGNYASYLRTQLIDSSTAKWRLYAHSKLNRARMRAEAAKARYAGHLSRDWSERHYRWVEHVLAQPHNALRPRVDGHSVIARQLLIQGNTVQGVLLLASNSRNTHDFVLYTPDAPDRRTWRSFAGPRALLRLLRQKPALRAYLAQRLPLLPAMQVEKLLLKGRLGKVLRTPAIDDDLFLACYMAEVRGMLAAADNNSHSTAEVNAEQALKLGWTLLDLISLFLPIKVMIPLALGRMALELWNGIEGYRQEDLNGVLNHAYNALSHLNDAGTSLASTGLMRRMLRGMPKQPPLPLPPRFSVTPETSNLRYRIDGVYGEEVHEKTSAFDGLSEYFIQDAQGRYFKVSFDGSRWRAIDPDRPDAYLTQPIKRLADGNWVIDSPLLWYDGLPDLARLFDDCRLQLPLAGVSTNGAEGLFTHDEQLYLQTRSGQLPLRRHLLAEHYHLEIPEASNAGVVPWAILRWQDGQWRIRVRQAGRSSAWLALPEAYSVSLGNRRSSR
ncbi:dermonecrotic toxin domain-containing protein [Pseudomonas sp. NPDC089996]|uniref:dermonecrotic toxin domain-containing protein n=1 Tax=Pseudomonas sp. NPDC089996 TaxID=3364474 RepID=UPI00382A2991